MGWIDLYSQGRFTADQDLEAYALKVGLFGLVPLLLPLLLGIAALVVVWSPKTVLQDRWALAFSLVPAIGLLIWATIVLATFSPITTANDGFDPIKVSYTQKEALHGAN